MFKTYNTVNFLKFRTFYSILFWLKFCFLSICILKCLVEWANSEDLDQTALSGAAWSVSALFAYGTLTETVVFEILGHLPYIIEVTKALSYNQNFILRELSSLAPLMYTCIKSWYCWTTLQKPLGQFPSNFTVIQLLKWDWEFVQMVTLICCYAHIIW